MKNSILTMGVVNLTPNSFSDGHLNNTQKEIFKKITQVISDFDITDLGAESTAPFNEAIGGDEEISRFDLFFDYMLVHDDPKKVLSIDTYKKDVFKEVYLKVKEFWPCTQIIWNDVSGCLDDSLSSLISEIGTDFKYVYCHNLAPKRSKTTEHMKYLTKEALFTHLENYFKDGVEKLDRMGIVYYLDPCFGFSKSREQNHELLGFFNKLCERFTSKTFVYGISKKSFLRFPKELDIKPQEGLLEVECLHSLCLQSLKSDYLIIRTHSLSPLKAAINFQELTNANKA